MWLSWQSGRFRHQRSEVGIPTLAKFNLSIVWNKKTKIKKKRPGKARFKKYDLVSGSDGGMLENVALEFKGH